MTPYDPEAAVREFWQHRDPESGHTLENLLAGEADAIEPALIAALTAAHAAGKLEGQREERESMSAVIGGIANEMGNPNLRG